MCDGDYGHFMFTGFFFCSVSTFADKFFFFLIIIIIDTVGGLDLHQPHFLMSEELQEASAGNAVHAAAPASWTPGTRWRSRICPICEELMKSHHYFIFNEKLLFSETFSGSASCLFLL